MMGPDWTQWHGNYEVGKHWYGKYLPEIEELIEENIHSLDPKKKAAAENLQRIYNLVVNDEFEVTDVATGKKMKSTGHKFYSGTESAELMEKRLKDREAFILRYEGKTDK
jgi:hypothetical protein